MPYLERIVEHARPPGFWNWLRSYTLGPLSLKDRELSRKLGWASTSSATGITVTEQSALTYSAFWAAVSLISGDIAALPLVFYKRTGETSRERYRGHPLYTLLHDQPNPEMTSVMFRRILQAHVLSWGNGYAEIERDGANRPAALWPITPDRVRPERQNGDIVYRVANPGRRDDLIPRASMLHIAGMGFDGLQGYSVVASARESIGMGLAAERFGGSFYGNGSTFGGMLSTDKQLSPKAMENLKLAIEARHQGVQRAHGLMVLEEGLKYEQIGVTPDDAQFLESRQFQVSEIARWFNLSPHKLADLTRATFSNIEQQALEHVTTTLMPWLRIWEQELWSKLVAPLEQRQQYFEFSVDGMLRGDSAGRAALETAHFQIGGVTPNELRAAENRNPIPGGDEAFVPLNMIPLSRINEWIDAEIASKKAKAAPPPPPPPAPAPSQRENELEWQVLSLEHTRDTLRGTVAEQSALVDVRAGERDVARAEVVALMQTLQTERAEHQRYIETVALDLKALTDERDIAQGWAKEYDKQRAAAVEQKAEAERQKEQAEDLARHAIELQTIAERERGEARSAQGGAEHAQQDVLRQLAEARKAEIDRMMAVVTAHRALVLDVMRRLVEREADRARSRQESPDRLRSWIETFYPSFEESAAEALLPAIRIHLAWSQSADDPDTVTRALVKAHIRESVRQLRSVADGESHEWKADLAKLLIRWEQQRPDAFADAVVAQEIAHVRSIHA